MIIFCHPYTDWYRYRCKTKWLDFVGFDGLCFQRSESVAWILCWFGDRRYLTWLNIWIIFRRSRLGNYRSYYLKTRVTRLRYIYAGCFEPTSDMYTSLQKWWLRVGSGQAVPHSLGKFWRYNMWTPLPCTLARRQGCEVDCIRNVGFNTECYWTMNIADWILYLTCNGKISVQ